MSAVVKPVDEFYAECVDCDWQTETSGTGAWAIWQAQTHNQTEHDNSSEGVSA